MAIEWNLILRILVAGLLGGLMGSGGDGGVEKE